MEIKELLRDEIKNLIPYEANQIDCKIKLDANESPYDMPEIIKAEVSKLFADNTGVNLYPDTDSNELRTALAKKWNLDKDMFMVGNGSDQVIQVLTNTFVGKGDKVLCMAPSFSMYGLSAQINGAEAINYHMKEETGYSIDPREFIIQAKEIKPKVIYLCNPNNPTGSLIPIASIKRILEECMDSIVVVDEAYNEFVNVSCVELLKTYKNLIILRTFSKAFGLAGVRCGYSIASKEITNYLNRVRPPYNLNSITQRVCTITLKHQNLIDEYIAKINVECKWLYNELLKIDGIKVFESFANFFLIKVNNSQKIAKMLLEDGILVRGYGASSELKDCIRVSVGTREQNEAFAQSLTNALKA